MGVIDKYQVDGWPDALIQLFTAVPAGFLLGLFLGLLGLGVFGLLRLFRHLLLR